MLRRVSASVAAFGVVALITLGAGVGAVVADRGTSTYEAAVVVDVSALPAPENGISLLPVGLSTSLAPAAAALVGSPGVIGPVAAASNPKIGAGELAHEVSAEAIEHGTVAVVHVRDHNARAAASYANAVADQLATYMVTISTDPTTNAPAVTARRAGSAAIPTQTLARPWRSDVLLGGLVGAGVALLVGVSQLGRRRVLVTTS